MNKEIQTIFLPIILKYMEDTETDLRARGYIPTLELAIEQLKKEIETRDQVDLDLQEAKEKEDGTNN